MEQIERIKTMEQHLDRASQVVMKLSAALDDYAEVLTSIVSWRTIMVVMTGSKTLPTMSKDFSPRT